MRFSFSEEQLAFAGSVRDYLEKTCPSDAVRKAADGDADGARERWRGLADLGVLGVVLPEQQGGLGLDEVDLVLALEEAGYACLPEPVGPTYVAASALQDGGATTWLSRVAGGEAVLAIGLGGPVAGEPDADAFVMADGDDLYLVPGADAEIEPLPSLDPTQPLSGVKWTPKANALLTGASVEAARDRGAFAASAELVGVARRCVELAAQHARDRQQFGRPIGSFQAVTHLLANAHLAVEFARPVVYRAAWSLANDVAERSRDASMAKAMASDAAVTACRAALQVHGAIGYTEEHDLHLWLKRGFALASMWGDAARHRERVARAIL